MFNMIINGFDTGTIPNCYVTDFGEDRQRHQGLNQIRFMELTETTIYMMELMMGTIRQ